MQCYDYDMNSARQDAYDDMIYEQNKKFKKEYWMRFFEEDEDLDDGFEIEDEAIIEEILEQIREDVKEKGYSDNRFHIKNPLR